MNIKFTEPRSNVEEVDKRSANELWESRERGVDHCKPSSRNRPLQKLLSKYEDATRSKLSGALDCLIKIAREGHTHENVFPKRLAVEISNSLMLVAISGVDEIKWGFMLKEALKNEPPLTKWLRHSLDAFALQLCTVRRHSDKLRLEARPCHVVVANGECRVVGYEHGDELLNTLALKIADNPVIRQERLVLSMELALSLWVISDRDHGGPLENADQPEDVYFRRKIKAKLAALKKAKGTWDDLAVMVGNFQELKDECCEYLSSAKEARWKAWVCAAMWVELGGSLESDRDVRTLNEISCWHTGANQDASRARKIVREGYSASVKADAKREQQRTLMIRQQARKEMVKHWKLENARRDIVSACVKIAIGKVVQAARARDEAEKRRKADEARAEAVRLAKEERRKKEERKEMLARVIQMNRDTVARREAHLAERAVLEKKAVEREKREGVQQAKKLQRKQWELERAQRKAEEEERMARIRKDVEVDRRERERRWAEKVARASSAESERVANVERVRREKEAEEVRNRDEADLQRALHESYATLANEEQGGLQRRADQSQSNRMVVPKVEAYKDRHGLAALTETQKCETKQRAQEVRKAYFQDKLDTISRQNASLDAFEAESHTLVRERANLFCGRLRGRLRWHEPNAVTSRLAPKHECVICFNATCTHIATACGHVIGCGACCASLTACPICCITTNFVEMRFPH